MDFRRIEQIFLIVFLCLDIFLFNIFRSGREGLQMNEGNAEEAIEQRLRKDDITFDTLSEKQLQGYYLSGEGTNFLDIINKLRNESAPYMLNRLDISDSVLTVYPRQQYFLENKEDLSGLSSMMDNPEAVVYGKEYEYLKNFSTISEKYQEIRLGQSYDGIPFIDDTSEIDLQLKKSESLLEVTSYTQTHLEEIEPLREKQDLCTEREAIVTLYNNSKIPSKSKIAWTQLGYSRILKVREKNVYVPVWFVGISSNGNAQQVERVNAINNTVITNSTITKVEK
ncbi:MAG: two-component system regulatory protein YycI [Lactobacillales bacterium]|jgi:regulatory protein YycI of two-component signal transduction system YycFG|nr:two-component system regulatory protein YycI [Lactobacillales bacterium]